MTRVERDKIVSRREARVLELCGEPGRVEELRVEEEDGRFGAIEAAHGARRRIGDVPERGVVVVRVREVDVGHLPGFVCVNSFCSVVLVLDQEGVEHRPLRLRWALIRRKRPLSGGSNFYRLVFYGTHHGKLN